MKNMNGDERCELCNNFARLKHNFGNGKGFQESHCCIAFVEDHVEVQEVSPNDMCEMFDRREDI